MRKQAVENAAGDRNSIAARRAIDARSLPRPHGVNEVLQLARQLIAGVAVDFLNVDMASK